MQNLKSLQTRKAKLKTELTDTRGQMRTCSKRENVIQQSLTHLDREIAKLAEKEPVASEHAILRYIERVMGIDVDEVKKKILSERNTKIIKTISSGKVPLEEGGFTLVVKDKVVVSVIEDK